MTDLTKWPRLLVTGRPVTEAQANEILIRTCQPAYLPGNDRDWTRTVNRILGLIDDGEAPAGIDQDARLAWYQDRWQHNDQRADCELRVINLEYLYTSRIASSWIGGPHGWCDWDGTIGCANYNIGKWPTAEEITGEWQRIATAFPYLDLTAQAVTDEGEGLLAAEWRVKDGHAELRAPGERIAVPDEISAAAILLCVTGLRSERGVSEERLTAAVAQVLAGGAA